MYTLDFISIDSLISLYSQISNRPPLCTTLIMLGHAQENDQSAFTCQDTLKGSSNDCSRAPTFINLSYRHRSVLPNEQDQGTAE